MPDWEFTERQHAETSCRLELFGVARQPLRQWIPAFPHVQTGMDGRSLVLGSGSRAGGSSPPGRREPAPAHYALVSWQNGK